MKPTIAVDLKQAILFRIIMEKLATKRNRTKKASK